MIGTQRSRGEWRSVLVGRERELRALRDGLGDTMAGSCQAVILTGEAGIGKSRLLTELRREAESQGCLVLSGQACQIERAEAFGLFVDALDEHVGELARSVLNRLGRDQVAELAGVLPSLESFGYTPASTVASERYRAHRSVRALLEGLAVDRPLVMLLDDVHWADGGSLELLATLLRRRPQCRLMLVMSVRPANAPRVLQNALQDDVVRVQPGPLDLEQARALLGPGVPELELEALHRESGGVPLYLEALARAQAPIRGSGASSSEGTPASVLTALAGELDALEEPGRTLLRGAAVAGDPFGARIAAVAAGVAEADALRLLDHLVARDLVRETDTPRRLKFRHPIVRRAVYEGAGPSWRFAAHRRVAVEMEAAGESALARAHHVALSARDGDERAIDLLCAAAAAAEARVPSVAAHWLGVAFSLLVGDQRARRLAILEAWAHALVSSGRLEEGFDALVDALSIAADQPSSIRIGLITACARVERLLGRAGHARARLDSAVAGLGPDCPAEVGAVNAELAAAAAWSSDLDEARARASAARSAALACGDTVMEASAEALLAYGEMGRGDAAEADGAITRAGARLDACGEDELGACLDAVLAVGCAAFHAGRFADSQRWLERGALASRRCGQGHLLVHLVSTQAMVLAMFGRLAAADTLADSALEAARLGPSMVALTWAWRQHCWIRFLLGDMPAAIRAGEEFTRLMREIGPKHSGAGAGGWVAGEVLLAAGEPIAATAVALELGGGQELPLSFSFSRCAGYEILTRAALAGGAEDEARRWANRSEHYAQSIQIGLARAIAARTRAHVLLASGDASSAARAALVSADLATRSAAPLDAARATLLAGRALAGAGEREGAITELTRARVQLAGIGARRIGDEASSALRTLGLRVSPTPVAASHHRSKLGRLSARELEVAELVAAGHSNKQVAALLHLSVNTVDSHLKQIRSKLEVHSRAAIASALAAWR